MMTELASNMLWTASQPMSVFGLPLGRRCAIARNRQGELVVFSPLEASAAFCAAIRSLGHVAAFIVPSRFHDHFYDGCFAEFPKARFLAGRAVMQDHPQWPLSELTAATPELAGFSFITLDGMPQVQEQVFYHAATRTLMIADAMFYVPGPHALMHRLLLRLAGIGSSAGPSRLFRSLIRDRARFTAALKRVLEWDFDRLIPGHGEIISPGAKAVFQQGYAVYLNQGLIPASR